jgi:ABC-type cobalamin transport system permease subunit
MCVEEAISFWWPPQPTFGSKAKLVLMKLSLEIFFTGLLVLASLAIAGLSVLVLFKLFKGQK